MPPQRMAVHSSVTQGCQRQTTCNHAIQLATPHRGRRDTFRHLLALLDPDIFATDALVDERINELSHSGTNRFFIRRLKESMVDWNRKPLFKPRHTETTAYVP